MQLRSLSLFSLEKRRLKGVTVVFSTLLRGIRGAGADLFTVVTSDRAREKGRELGQGRFSLSVRKRFFTQSIVRHWDRFPREMGTAPSPSEFEKGLNNMEQSHQVSDTT